jgi:aminopeptidase N
MMNKGFHPFTLKNWLTILIILVSLIQGFSQPKLKGDAMIWKQESRFGNLADGIMRPWYKQYDVTFCHLDLHLERNTVYIEGNVRTNARSRVDGLQDYCCELIDGLTVDSVFYNSLPAEFIHTGDSIVVHLFPSPSEGELLSIRIFYHGLPPTGGYFSGISTAVSERWGNEVTWTLSQPFNAKQWWPCKQDLRDKYDSVYVYITTDQENKAGSNGLLTAVEPLPGNKVRYEWKSHYPVDYYLISAAVARYQEYNLYAHPEGSPDSLLIQNYIYDAPGCLDYYKNELDNTRYHLELFAKLFGPYPFDKEKYGHCLVNLGGGMEHQTMGSLGDFNFHLTSHELSHQWFGDHVTCADWSDIWLNEGFATYAQYLSLQYLASQAYADSFMMGVHYYVMSQPGGSVFIPPGQAITSQRIFDGRLSYNKGAAIIHALRGEIHNDALFFNILKQFMISYGDSVATAGDFKLVAEQVSGADLEKFFEQWYYGEGYPVFDIGYWQDKDSLWVTVFQSATSSVTPFFDINLELKLKASGQDTLIRIVINKSEILFKIPWKKPIDSIIPDPWYWNIMKINTLMDLSLIPSDKRLQIFPNPCHSSLNYRLRVTEPGPFNAEVYDLQGKKVISLQLMNLAGLIDVSALNQGLYIMEIHGRNFHLRKKIIKN